MKEDSSGSILSEIVRPLLKRIEQDASRSTCIPGNPEREKTRESLEDIYRTSLKIAQVSLKELAQYQIREYGPMKLTDQVSLERDVQDAYICQSSSAEFVTSHILRCTISSPPMLKKKINARQYKDIFGRGLAINLSAAVHKQMADSFHKFSHCTVIFIQHHEGTGQAEAPYYDNDNLAIKYVLDEIIPVIAYDDASFICDNIYTLQNDNRDFAEIFVVENGHLNEWLSLFPDSSFSKNMRNEL